MSFEITGKVHLIGKEEAVGNNGFTKRLLVVATSEQYSQLIPIDFVKDKCILLDNYSVGQEIKVSVNVRGNEYNGKYYVNLQGWKAESLEQPKTGAPGTYSENNPPKKDPITLIEEDPDLPF